MIHVQCIFLILEQLYNPSLTRIKVHEHYVGNPVMNCIVLHVLLSLFLLLLSSKVMKRSMFLLKNQSLMK